ncbi:beta-lactamase family protein [Streptomyces sp. NBC_01239]|uniref:serine hydrolase domain-containing protein n=1 Tax=Streptomyces sp. NBC_01239 TaxID=2903792 RepID=UPI002253805C|nr:serine hydrolase domain-containing protein [Streptomyces sp. NBC_01239]MCX4815168.1 beta-lactamase family protein [Streptomyces sp. NBC_01239]
MATNSDSRISRALEQALGAGETGVQVAAYLDGELIVDAWAGETGAGRPVDHDTLFPVFSVTKALAASTAHVYAQRGLLDLDGPVAKAWPEYAAHGKGGITFDHVLSHRSGAPSIGADTTLKELCDWSTMTAKVADQVPFDPPDVRNAYSPYAFGWVLGEAVRRVDPEGRSFHQIVRDDVLLPLGMDDFFLGLPDEQRHRVAVLGGEETPTLPPSEMLEAASPAHLPFAASLFNLPELQRAGLPSAGGIATARATARLFSAYATVGRPGDPRFFTADTLRRCQRPRPLDVDHTYGFPIPVGHGGLWHIAPGVSDSHPGGSLTEGVLSHTGAGGTVAWAEPERGLSVAIVHNRLFFGQPQVNPFGAVADAVYEVAAEQS